MKTLISKSKNFSFIPISLILILLLSFQILIIQCQWIKLKPQPDLFDVPPNRNDNCALLYNNKMYIYGGYTCPFGICSSGGMNLNDTWEFDFVTNTWTELPNYGESIPKGRNGFVCTLYQDLMFVYGGWTGNNSNEFWTYNLTSYYWTKLNVWSNQTYNFTSNSWENVSNPNDSNFMYFMYRNGGVGITWEDSVIFGGGWGGSPDYGVDLGDFWLYNFTTQQIRLLKNDTSIRYYKPGMAIFENKLLCLFDGRADTSSIFRIDCYNISLPNPPALLLFYNSPPKGRYGATILSTSNNTVVVFGGVVFHNTLGNDLYIFSYENATNSFSFQTLWDQSKVAQQTIFVLHDGFCESYNPYPFPSSRSFTSGIIYSKSFVIFGGEAQLNMNDLWAYPLTLSNVVIPTDWFCLPTFYNASDGCHCNCGYYDPDCNDPYQPIYGCSSGSTCDLCGICNGNSSSCAGCDGIPYSNVQYDQCGFCGGNSTNPFTCCSQSFASEIPQICFKCSLSNVYFPIEFYCDGFNDCQDYSDETAGIRNRACVTSILPAEIFILCVGVIPFITVIVFLILLTIKRNSPIIKFAFFPYILTTGFGILLGIASIIPFGSSASPASCIMRIWLPNLAFDLLFGSVLIRQFRLWKVFQAVQALRYVRITPKNLLPFFLAIFGVEIILLSLWTGISPVVVTPSPHPDFPGFVHNICSSSLTVSFLPLILIYKLFLLILGIYFAWSSRALGALTHFNESKNLAIVIYSFFLVGIIVVPAVLLISNSPIATFLIISLGILSLCTLSMILLLGTQVKYIYFQSSKESKPDPNFDGLLDDLQKQIEVANQKVLVKAIQKILHTLDMKQLLKLSEEVHPEASKEFSLSNLVSKKKFKKGLIIKDHLEKLKKQTILRYDSSEVEITSDTVSYSRKEYELDVKKENSENQD